MYRLTRNPMYVGLALLLVVWALHLSSAWVLLGLAAFVLYMNRFQIQPEERAQFALFDSRYDEYKSNVRRWL